MEKNEKKEYQTPRLKNYGPVTEITEVLGMTHETDATRDGSMEPTPQ